MGRGKRRDGEYELFKNGKKEDLRKYEEENNEGKKGCVG